MLAAGCIPVVNDTIEVRTDLNNPFVRYTPAYPIALAEQLEAVILEPDFAALSQAAATSVQSITWDEAGASIDAILRRALQQSAEPARIIDAHTASRPQHEQKLRAAIGARLCVSSSSWCFRGLSSNKGARRKITCLSRVRPN